ncbi:unnamed protein product [Cutaneotrichosporon oleaginosum]
MHACLKMDAVPPVRASTRLSIAWGDRPPSEDTDTLVLTLDGIALDLRVFTCGPQAGEIEWASVGVISHGEGHTEATPRLVWTHLLDSRRPPPTPASPGAFAVLNATDVRETGRMYNPATERHEAYAEIWRRFAASGPYAVLERVDGVYGSHESTADADAAGPRAFVAHFGRWALGVARDEDGAFAAYRDDNENGWVRKYEFGAAGAIPSIRALGGGLRVGERVRLEVGEWEVRVAGIADRF